MHISSTIVNNVLLSRITFVSSNLFLGAAALLSINFPMCTCSKGKKMDNILKHIALLRKRKNKQVSTPFTYFHRKVNSPPLLCCYALTDHGIPGGGETGFLKKQCSAANCLPQGSQPSQLHVHHAQNILQP